MNICRGGQNGTFDTLNYYGFENADKRKVCENPKEGSQISKKERNSTRGIKAHICWISQKGPHVHENEHSYEDKRGKRDFWVKV